MISAGQAREAERVLQSGGLILFGADTVYGLACAHDHPEAIGRMIELKGRDAHKPNAFLAFTPEAAAPLLGGLGPRTRAATGALLPGPVTLVLPGGAGLRVPQLVPGAEALAAINTLVVQSSANLAGEPAARSVDGVAPEIVAGVDLILDAGELPGTASTVVDLSAYEDTGSWSVLRAGAVAEPTLVAILGRR